jgi:hypothetical protein
MGDYVAMEEGEGELRRNKCVQDLTEGYDIETKNQDGETAIMSAARQ